VTGVAATGFSLLSCSIDGAVREWELRKFEPIATFIAPNPIALWSVASDGLNAIYAVGTPTASRHAHAPVGEKGRIDVFNHETAELRWSESLDSALYGCVFDSSLGFVTAGKDKVIRLWQK
jgi:WD40 repeat protein